MKLAIISHTEHYLNADGTVVGWGPTVSEINHLAADFDTIYHIAFLHSKTPPSSSLPYIHNNIQFIALEPVGGAGLESKLEILTSIPKILKVVKDILKKVDVFQLRTPTGMGVFLIPYLSLFTHKKGWYKYAGNWNQKNPPLGYRLQRAMLKRQKRKVTINGKWPQQPKHCLTFENPCLTEYERKVGYEWTQAKRFEAPYIFCFVGRLEDAKGVQRIIDAFGSLNSLERVRSIHFVGDGPKSDDYKRQVINLGLPIHFHGFLERERVFEIYRQSHFFLLPSTASEGFPKVIAEAMNFGCIPIVSDVSSIGQYVNEDNGFLLRSCTAKDLATLLAKTMECSGESLRKKNILAHQDVFQFTFENYRSRIQKEIIG